MSIVLQRIFSRLRLLLDAALIILIFFVINFFSLVGIDKFPDVNSYSNSWWGLSWVCASLLLIVVIVTYLQGLFPKFVRLLKQNKAVLFFLLVALSSLLWSTYFQASLFKLFFLILATGAGIYFAVRYTKRELLDILSCFAVFSVLVSFFAIFLTPVGIMQNNPYTGSWRGFFWHRNHAGSLAALFSMIFLVRFLFEKKGQLRKMLWGVFYILSVIFTIGSHSVTGLIIFLVLSFLVVLGYFWIRWNSYIKPLHYYILSLIGVVLLVILLTNLEFFFGLLGRSSTMTGRTPMWKDLIGNVWTQHPLLGYGYGALWMQYDFREALGVRLGWDLFYPYFADNGFLDILLNLGLIGFVPFVIAFLSLGVRSLRSFILSRSWLDLWVLIVFIYIFFANIAYSFLLEVDQFVWMLMVMMLFTSTDSTGSEKAIE